MPIPDYQSLMLPVLQLAADGQQRKAAEAVTALAERLQLSEAELAERVPSGQQTVFANRVSWARTYLKKAGLLHAPQRGHFAITEEGLALLASGPDRVDNRALERFDGFRAFQGARQSTDLEEPPAGLSEGPKETPDAALARSYEELKASLADELLDTVKAATPAFFERLVVDLLLAMGYGGGPSATNAPIGSGQVLGQSGDGGIDGVINEDPLGLDVIYLQAKRWEGTVGRPEIQKFAGALQGQRARRGVFITTSQFSREALDYAELIEASLILIDGKRLSELMVQYNVGVSEVAAYTVKRIDSDYFDEVGG